MSPNAALQVAEMTDMTLDELVAKYDTHHQSGPPAVECDVRAEWEGQLGYAVKPAFIPQLPYERTLDLDTDTVVRHSDAAKPLDLITDRYGYHAAAVHCLSRRMHKVARELKDWRSIRILHDRSFFTPIEDWFASRQAN